MYQKCLLFDNFNEKFKLIHPEIVKQSRCTRTFGTRLYYTRAVHHLRPTALHFVFRYNESTSTLLRLSVLQAWAEVYVKAHVLNAQDHEEESLDLLSTVSLTCHVLL